MRFLVCTAGPVVSVSAAVIQAVEGVQNLHGETTLDGLGNVDLNEDWRYALNAGASLLAFLLALMLIAGCVAYEIGRDWGRRACLWSCGIYVALTLAINLLWAATIEGGGVFLFLLIFTVAYPALVLLLLRWPLEPEQALSKRTGVSPLLLLKYALLGGVITAVAIPNLLAARISTGESYPIATLRNLSTCQMRFQTSGKVDVDGDETGEFGTFLELSGAVPVRRSADWTVRGTPLVPSLLSAWAGGVDADGIVTKAGYCFRIYLADTASPVARWVHERGPAGAPGFAGGTGKVHTDLAETTWCAYAWPVKLRWGEQASVYFINQAGDVTISRNEKTRWEGMKRPPTPDSAFRGQGITSPVAAGTAGRDGEVWRFLN